MKRKDDLYEKVMTYSEFGKLEKGGITRLTLSEADIAGRNELVKRCEKLGLQVFFDDMGNIYARREGTENLPAIAVGSHMDSVKYGGNYDGILGVLTGLSVIEHLEKEKITTRHPIVLIDFTNEEGVRYEPSLFASGVITGELDEEKLKNQKDEYGKRFIDALKESGFEGEKRNRLSGIGSFIELHIEQGPVLENKNASIGIVEGIVGMSCYKITVTGDSGHAGTIPMVDRKDPMITTMKLINYLNDYLSELAEDLVVTFGKIQVFPNVHTVIPNQVEFYVEFRHKDEEVLQRARLIIEKCVDYDSKCHIAPELQWKRHTVNFAPKLIDAVTSSVKEKNLVSHKMYSGAGHDAQYIAEKVPTTMIFVPSVNGKSHCPEEYTSIEHCINGRDVLLSTLLKYDKEVD